MQFTETVFTYKQILFHLRDHNFTYNLNRMGEATNRQHAAIIWRFLKFKMCFLRKQEKWVY